MIERDLLFLPPGRITAKQIIATVASRHGLTPDDLKGPKRTYPICHARHEAMWTIRRHTKLSTTNIGIIFGGRDHSSVIHATRRHEERMGALAVAA